MRISRQRAEREVNVYNICTEHDDRTEFQLTERGGKYGVCYPVVATDAATTVAQVAAGGGLFDFGVSDMTARELHFFMEGVFAGENKAIDTED